MHWEQSGRQVLQGAGELCHLVSLGPAFVNVAVERGHSAALQHAFVNAAMPSAPCCPSTDDTSSALCTTVRCVIEAHYTTEQVFAQSSLHQVTGFGAELNTVKHHKHRRHMHKNGEAP